MSNEPSPEVMAVLVDMTAAIVSLKAQVEALSPKPEHSAKESSMQIINDRLHKDGEPVPYVRSPNQGGRISPTLIVLHDTAGRLTPGTTVNWFKDPKAKVSAHFVVEVDGSITQMVDCDRAAWHAGKSSWGGRSGCNSFSIGIEIVNPGKLATDGTAWFGQRFAGAVECTTKEHGRGCWLPYTPAQIGAVKALCEALTRAYPIKDIVTHWQISPGRKVDCNPLFPLDEVRAAALSKKPAGTDHWPLQVGSEGANVRTLQQRLLTLGYSMVKHADGIFGPQTRAGVVAWEAENGVTLDGKIDRAEFEKLMAPESKELPVGPATAQAEADQKASTKAIEATAATAAVTIAGNEAVSSVEDQSLWEIFMGNLGLAGEAVSKITVMGVQLDQRVALAALGTVGALAVWRWARIARAK